VRFTALEAEKNDEIEAIRHEYRLKSSKSAALEALAQSNLVDLDLAYTLIAEKLVFDGDNANNLDDAE